MEESSKVHVGLDVHKDSISVGAAEAGRAPGRVIGKTAHDVNKLLKMLGKLGSRSSCTWCTRQARPATACSEPCRPGATCAR